MYALAKKSYHSIYRLTAPVLRLLAHQAENWLHQKTGKPIIYCIGDSHNAVFDYIKKADPMHQAHLRCVTVTGATIFGLANPNSKSNALPIFQRELRNAPKGAFVTVLLGEIDCGFLIWLRAQKNSTSINIEFNESLSRYTSFIKWLQSLPVSGIGIISVPPQTIPDGPTTSDIANQRSAASASYKERTILTNQYNENLKRISNELDICFINMDAYLLDQKTGTAHSSLLSRNPKDHHLNKQACAPLYAEALHNFVSHHKA